MDFYMIIKTRFISTLKLHSKTALICDVANMLAHNVGSYTQGRTAGDFLSSRKTARAERYTPKTTAAGLAG
jgi:hypothetical protein